MRRTQIFRRLRLSTPAITPHGRSSFRLLVPHPNGTIARYQQFRLLVRNLDDALRSAGRAFNEVRDERTDADYDKKITPSPTEAREALQRAINFLDVCAARYGFHGGQIDDRLP